jgi:hypothetical protein
VLLSEIEDATDKEVKIVDIILAAKLGRTRKDAQVDTCAVFAAALYDVLSSQNIPCKLFSAENNGLGKWAHAAVKVGNRYYDSMGEFSASIYRARAKVHPKVTLDITYKPDRRTNCYEPEFDELHAFYVKMLNNAIKLGR